MIRKCIKVDTHRTYHIINEAEKKYEGVIGRETVKVRLLSVMLTYFRSISAKARGVNYANA